jgi:hypothetical protein
MSRLRPLKREEILELEDLFSDPDRKGIWPPKGGGDELVRQNNKILVAAPFSPLL